MHASVHTRGASLSLAVIESLRHHRRRRQVKLLSACGELQKTRDRDERRALIERTMFFSLSLSCFFPAVEYLREASAKCSNRILEWRERESE